MRHLFLISLLLLVPALALAQDTSFVSLTKVPFLTDTASSFNLSQFLNTLYRLALGAAAVIAVLQIMRAGIMYMGGDSVTEKKEAKNLIGLSIAGLVLVLSPVVVFSIINPEILSLKIDRLGELAARERAFLDNARGVIEVPSARACRDAGGTVESEGPPVTCSVPLDSDAWRERNSCEAFTSTDSNFPSPAIAQSSCALELGESYVPIDGVCCQGMQEGAVCCGRNATSGDQGPTVFIDEPIVYYRYQEYNRRENQGRLIDVVPAHQERVRAYVAACSAAGREFEIRDDDNWAEEIFTARWTTCPNNVGVPASTGNTDTVYQCEDMRSVCLPAE